MPDGTGRDGAARPGGYAAVDVGYLEPGRARAALVIAAGPDFSGPLAEHVACVTGVAPYSPGEFFRRELPVLRGSSARPLYVTAAGLPLDEAAGLLRRMAGRFRLPEALRRVDALSRGAVPRGR
jgi:deoxyinosine 3'endonuclease (endonuclease V)